MTDASRVTDPILAQVVRGGLISAGNQMKSALMRTAFSPAIYESGDCAAALYDTQFRLLGQAPTHPLFMGTMSHCVRGAIQNVGGDESLAPGDVILYNIPYGTGSHAQDAALVMPIFDRESQLVGYGAIKAHLADVGAKEVYSTDTNDIHQEGTFFPGVKLWKAHERDEELWRTVLANTRMPALVEGDINAERTGLRAGAEALVALRERIGPGFDELVEVMFDHGEQQLRAYLRTVPDGTHVARGAIDSDGLSDELVPFEVRVTIEQETCIVDVSECPDACPGPINCPLPTTMSACQLAITSLFGGAEAPNEGHLRPIEVVTRPGSLFDARDPSPCFLYGWPAFHLIEAIYLAVGSARPDSAPAGSGGDIMGLVWWGVRRASGQPWADGLGLPVGQGAHAAGDGANATMHIAIGATRTAPAEVWEARNPWHIERVSLIPDSGGAGRHRGGLGVDYHIRATEESFVTTIFEHTKTSPAGLAGGEPGLPNAAWLRSVDGTRVPVSKATKLEIEPGSVLEIRCGGGGGFGSPAERSPEAIDRDIEEGYVTLERARSDYPQWSARVEGNVAGTTSEKETS